MTLKAPGPVGVLILADCFPALVVRKASCQQVQAFLWFGQFPIVERPQGRPGAHLDPAGFLLSSSPLTFFLPHHTNPGTFIR